MTNTIKLQKFLSQAGIASRRQAEKLIEAKQVQINGQTATLGQRINPQTDEIKFQGKKVSVADKVYYLINKPLGVVSTTSDELKRRTVLSLIPKLTDIIYPVGRLDIESEGLMLLTNDGELAQKLTHPSFEIPKTYEVLVSGTPSTKALEHLERGVKLKDGFTRPAQVEVLSYENNNTWLQITITEGRNRQVRRMMERVGYPVIKLIRVKFGPFNLADLAAQQFIQLESESIKSKLALAQS